MPNDPNHKPPFLQFIRSGWELLTRREKIKVAGLTVFMVAVNWMTTASWLALLLVVGLVLQPESTTIPAFLTTINKGLGALSFAQLAQTLSILVIALMVISAAGEWLLQYLLERFGAACQDRLATQLMGMCVGAPYSWFLKHNSISLARFLYDDVAVWNRGFVQRSMTIVDNLIQVVVTAVVVLWAISWLGIAAAVAAAGLAYLGLRLTRPVVKRLAAEKRNALESTNLAASQVFAGIRDVKLSSREGYFVERFSTSYGITTRTHALLNVLQGTPPLVLRLLGQVGLIAFVMALWNVGRSSTDIAVQIGLLYMITARLVPAVSTLASLFGNLWNAAPYVDGIHALMQGIDERVREEDQHDDAAKATVGRWKEIAMVDVGFKYPDSPDCALKNINLTIKRGQVYGIVGRTAAGKSTLVDLLVGLLPPSEGRIRLDDHPLEAFSLRSWRSGIGYVSQSPYIADDSLRDNVAFGVRRQQVDNAWVLDCLRLANLEHLPDDLELGLDTRLGERGVRLSGGQRQRLAIARALYNRPDILILDEATSALDTISEKEIMAALENLRQRVTMVIIAHRLTTVMNCDHLFVLEDGRLVGQGLYSELKAGHALFAQMASGLAEPITAMSDYRREDSV